MIISFYVLYKYNLYIHSTSDLWDSLILLLITVVFLLVHYSILWISHNLCIHSIFGGHSCDFHTVWGQYEQCCYQPTYSCLFMHITYTFLREFINHLIFKLKWKVPVASSSSIPTIHTINSFIHKMLISPKRYFSGSHFFSFGSFLRFKIWVVFVLVLAKPLSFHLLPLIR